MKSDIRCQNQSCKDSIAAWGENHHGVHVVDYDVPHLKNVTTNKIIAMCERCGGHFDGENWFYVCKSCGKQVEPGNLMGLFVPHRCQDCDTKLVEEQKRNGDYCHNCKSVIAYCCC